MTCHNRSGSALIALALAATATHTSTVLGGGDDPWADTVESYRTGDCPEVCFHLDPATALGPPTRFAGEGSCCPGAVTPFQPAFDLDEVVSIGLGGELVVRFATAVTDDPANPFGVDLIVFGNAGFIDLAWPAGIVDGLFGDGGTIEISPDGQDWTAVPGLDADGLHPTLGWLDTGPYDVEPGRVESDFTRPVDPGLGMDELTGLSHGEVVDLYRGSGGGTGVDIGALGLDRVSFVRIRNATDAAGALEIDAFADVAPAVIGDVNGDGVVNVEDLIAVVLQWGPARPGTSADLNADGIVDVEDLIIVVLSFG